jgi:hypothetical protein
MPGIPRTETYTGHDEGVGALPFTLFDPNIRDNAGFDKQPVAFPCMVRDARANVAERGEPKMCDGLARSIALGGFGGVILADEAESNLSART